MKLLRSEVSAAAEVKFAPRVAQVNISLGGVLVNQIVKSATSIGANIHEANYAASKADFINKFHIALKECGETEKENG